MPHGVLVVLMIVLVILSAIDLINPHILRRSNLDESKLELYKNCDFRILAICSAELIIEALHALGIISFTLI